MEKTRPWQDADFVVVGHAPSELPEGMVTIDERGQRFLDQLVDEYLVVATIAEEM